MKINMHIHSNHSLDGELDINELIKRFESDDFNIISITDHNTCDAYKEIQNKGNIKIVNGIEADAMINNHTYDFLCYDFELERVADFAYKRYGSIEQRQKKIFDALVELCNSKKIGLKDVTSYDASNEYAHAAIFRMIDDGFLKEYHITCVSDLYRMSTIQEDFPLYIDMHIVWPDIKELVSVIHEAGGKVFLAHPYKYNQPVLEVLNEAKNLVDGIEISNNPENEQEVKFLYGFAKNNNLLVSVGSDYHGKNRDRESCDFLTEEMLQNIAAWIK